MKNNMIIAGVPRAGKSTISRRLAKQYGYQHISMDSIIAGFEKCFPETGVNTYAGLSSMDTLHLISGKIAPFIRAMLDSGEYDEFKPGMVLDIYQLLPDDYMKYIHGANCEIVYFITSDVTPEERFAIQKKYDTEKDYTFYKSDEELREGAEYIVEQSIYLKRQCQKHGLPYFETARDREKIFRSFLQDYFFNQQVHIIEVSDAKTKSIYAREILESLPQWFGNRDSLEEYVENAQELPFWAALDVSGKCLGFFSVRIHYGHTGDIYVCGVRPECHNKGIGKALYDEAERYFLREGCRYAMVETLSDTVDYPPYENTRRFYESVGFEPLITLTEMWDEKNPCLIMVKSLAR